MVAALQEHAHGLQRSQYDGISLFEYAAEGGPTIQAKPQSLPFRLWQLPFAGR